MHLFELVALGGLEDLETRGGLNLCDRGAAEQEGFEILEASQASDSGEAPVEREIQELDAFRDSTDHPADVAARHGQSLHARRESAGKRRDVVV